MFGYDFFFFFLIDKIILIEKRILHVQKTQRTLKNFKGKNYLQF